MAQTKSDRVTVRGLETSRHGERFEVVRGNMVKAMV